MLKLHRRRAFGSALPLACAALLAGIAAWVGIAAAGGHPTLARMSYAIAPLSAADKTLSVAVAIERNRYLGPRTFTLHTSELEAKEWTVLDDRGDRVPYRFEGDTVTIGPVGAGAERVRLTYRVQVGLPGSRGYQGEYAPDLAAFAGRQALMLPETRLGRLAVTIAAPAGSRTVAPFGKSALTEGGAAIAVRHPGWKTYYDLAQSLFAFGDLRETRIDGARGPIPVVLDGAAGGTIPAETEAVVRALSDYYAGLFGGPLPDTPVVLLRRAADGNPIVAGVGAASLGAPLAIEDGDDIGALSHSLFTAYFDSRAGIEALHAPPNLWLYKGLATYYESRSLDALPPDIRAKYGLSAAGAFERLYDRYIYFRLKEPALFKVTPAMEASALGGQLQFFHYTEAPLIVQAIEEAAQRLHGGGDALLRQALKSGGGRTFDQGRIVSAVAGGEAERIYGYLAGEAILPAPARSPERPEDSAKTVRQLDDYEKLLDSWLIADVPGYPYDRLEPLDPDAVADETVKRKLRYASDDVEAMVGAYSPAIALLLDQYRLRADIAGERDPNDPSLKLKLFGDEAKLQAWADYALKLGGSDRDG